MPVVSAKHLHKAYGARVVLSDAEVTVRTGERVGVVGKNGAGKSTLARILAGVEAPDRGTVSRRRGATVQYLDQVPHFDGDPTAEEAVASGLAAWSEALERHAALSRALSDAAGDVDALVAEQQEVTEDIERLGGFDRSHEVSALLGRLGIDRPGARVSTLSGGEQRRVALARVLIANPDLTILDEPTNHLDAETVEWLEQRWLGDPRGALVLITHDRYLLDRVATRTLEVSDAEVHAYDGGYELYLEQKALRLAHAARTEQNRQNLLRRELEWLRRQPKARSTKQKARVDRAEAALATEAPRAEQDLSLSLELSRTGKTILEADALRVEIGGRTLVHGLTFALTQGERVGIIGKNGSGKTTLLSTLLGQRPPAGGTVTLGKNTRVAYFDQHRSGLDDEATVHSAVIGEQSRLTFGGKPIEPHAYLERFGLDGGRARQRIGSLSGGERARVALARLLRQPSNLVVMDEPTNDLDVATLSALEELLVGSGATALVVTHDRWFLDRVATSILTFEPEGNVVRYPGNYTTMQRLRAEARARTDSAGAPAGGRTTGDSKKDAARPDDAASGRQRPKTRRGLSYSEKRELEGLPDAIEAAEARVRGLTTDLARPETYTGGGDRVARLTAELDAARAEVERLTERWVELEEKSAP